MKNERGELGENLNFRIWTELKAARVAREAHQEERARDRDADRLLGLEHVQLAIEGAPRGAIVRVQGQGMTQQLTAHDMQGRVAEAKANGAAAHAYFVRTRCALDSGGDQHYVGKNDVHNAYEWRELLSPIGVDTANGRVEATHSCRIQTDLGVMTCYYLENGGPEHTLLSVDKLCVDSDLVYVHTKEGAYLYYRDTGL